MIRVNHFANKILVNGFKRLVFFFNTVFYGVLIYGDVLKNHVSDDKTSPIPPTLIVFPGISMYLIPKTNRSYISSNLLMDLPK